MTTPELITAPAYRVTLPSGETYLTEDVELVENPVWRCLMPNGEAALMEPPGECSHCRPEVHRVGRRTSALVTWMCTSGCGNYPPDQGGGPLDQRAS